MAQALHELFSNLSPRYVGCTGETIVESVCDDSRRVRTGDLFVATHGGQHDGHDFVPGAIAAGARVVVVEPAASGALSHPHVILDDTNAALPVLAANAFGRPGDALELAGVTGTNGKTTTTHLVAGMLRAAGRRFIRIGTTGHELDGEARSTAFTTPFPLELQALLREAVDRGVSHGVMEVSSHALAQGRARPLRFAAVGLTSFSQDHLDFHGTMEAYLAAKCELARSYTHATAVAVAAIDEHPGVHEFLRSASLPRERVWRASKGADATAEIRAETPRFDATGTRARIHTPVGSYDLHTPLLGSYNLDNILVATGLGLGLGLDLPAIARGLERTSGAPGRLEVVKVPGVTGPAVVVDYAHTPDAVTRALAAVTALSHGRVFIVLGCGGDRDPAKRPLMGTAAAEGSERFYATSDNPRTEAPERIIADMLAGVPAPRRDRVVQELDRATAIATAIADASPDDLVLIAGKGHETYQVVGDERRPFDDREHARQCLLARASR